MSIYDRLSRTTATPSLLRTLRRGYLVVRRLLERLGLQVVVASYDSPIPDITTLDVGFFERPDPMHGIAFDVDRQLDFLEAELAEYCKEFDPPGSAAAAGPHRFHLGNGTYESVDAELLYGMVRRFEPEQIVELGSGYSTLIIREALGRSGRSVDALRTFDPYPSSLLAPDWPVTPLRVQDIGDEVFTGLGSGDLLFVDTSHTVKAGGDVNRIVLGLLPILAPGVIVHFHDIFLPLPYSRSHLEDAHFWNEQYLLQAFLAQNEAWEVLVGGQAIARAHPGRVAAAVPSFNAMVSPGAFWIRRRQ